MTTTARSIVQEYYTALREGESLEPYFYDDESTVKFGISEALFGYAAIASALREQTATTEAWTVESNHLVVEERETHATMADEVTMAWTDTETGDRRRFETRWSGTLVPTSESGGNESADRPSWRFITMHVSAPHDL